MSERIVTPVLKVGIANNNNNRIENVNKKNILLRIQQPNNTKKSKTRKHFGEIEKRKAPANPRTAVNQHWGVSILPSSNLEFCDL